MWTARGRLRLHVRAVWSGLLLSTISIIGHFRMYVSIEPKSPDATAHAWGEPETVLFCAYFKRPFRLARPKCRWSTLVRRCRDVTRNVETTSYRRRITLQRRWYYVVLSLRATLLRATSKQCRTNVDVTSRRCIDVDATLYNSERWVMSCRSLKEQPVQSPAFLNRLMNSDTYLHPHPHQALLL